MKLELAINLSPDEYLTELTQMMNQFVGPNERYNSNYENQMYSEQKNLHSYICSLIRASYTLTDTFAPEETMQEYEKKLITNICPFKQ